MLVFRLSLRLGEVLLRLLLRLLDRPRLRSRRLFDFDMLRLDFLGRSVRRFHLSLILILSQVFTILIAVIAGISSKLNVSF